MYLPKIIRLSLFHLNFFLYRERLCYLTLYHIVFMNSINKSMYSPKYFSEKIPQRKAKLVFSKGVFFFYLSNPKTCLSTKYNIPLFFYKTKRASEGFSANSLQQIGRLKKKVVSKNFFFVILFFFCKFRVLRLVVYKIVCYEKG